MLKNHVKIIISLIAAIVFVFWAFNFVMRDVMILASRTLARQILDYILNIIIFFIVFYLLLSLYNLIVKKLTTK